MSTNEASPHISSFRIPLGKAAWRGGSGMGSNSASASSQQSDLGQVTQPSDVFPHLENEDNNAY